MKKLFAILTLFVGLALTQAQTTKPTEKEEVKKTSTPVQ